MTLLDATINQLQSGLHLDIAQDSDCEKAIVVLRARFWHVCAVQLD